MITTKYPKLQTVVALDDYSLELEYENGEKRRYDFKPNLNHSFYKALQSLTLFKSVSVIDGLVIWQSGQDFCPNTLYDKSVLV